MVSVVDHPGSGDVFGMYRDMGLWAHGHLEDALGPMATCVLRARYGLQ